MNGFLQMTKKILITGGAGFIGSALSIKLLIEGYDVIVYDSLSPQIHGDISRSYTYNLIKDKVEFIKDDIRNKDNLKKAIKDASLIVHLAAETGTGQSMYEIEKYVDVNVRGTAILLELVAEHGKNVEKLILSSSRAVYGEGKYRCQLHGVVYPNTRRKEDMLEGDFECKCPICSGTLELLPTDENSLLSPVSIYGITKLQQEQLVQSTLKAIEIPFTILRFQNVYGPGQSLSNPYTGILSIFSNLLRQGECINIFEDGNESRDFVFIQDVVNSIILSMSTTMSNNQIFNVGSGQIMSVLELAKQLKSFYKSKSNLNITGDFRVGDIRHNIADLTHITNLLKFLPNYDFNNGLKLYLTWVLTQKNSSIKYSESLKELSQKQLFISRKK